MLDTIISDVRPADVVGAILFILVNKRAGGHGPQGAASPLIPFQNTTQFTRYDRTGQIGLLIIRCGLISAQFGDNRAHSGQFHKTTHQLIAKNECGRAGDLQTIPKRPVIR